MKRFLLSLALLVCSITPSRAQDTLQSPWQYLGVPLGERYTPHTEMMRYARYVAQRTPTAQLIEYGKTYEGRPLVVMAFASAEHARQLEAIRTDHLRRAGLLEGSPIGAPRPLVLWLSYNVHGNEASASEAALEMLYRLGDPRNAAMQAVLKHAIVLIDPCINPDGRDRFAHSMDWRQTPGIAPDVHPDALVNAPQWPSSRTNHYRFDLNRDWAWQTQIETRSRIALYQQWMPHLHADYHEMGPNSPYYFLPAAEPFHSLITPWQRDFQHILGRANAQSFDRSGKLFFTQETFDLLAPHFGDTYPIFNGAIGMTYEQGGQVGTAYRTRIGDTLTLAMRAQNQVHTSIATLETSVAERERMQREYEAYFERGRTNPTGAYKSFVIRGDNPKLKLDDFLAHLRANGIRYSYVSGSPAKATAPQGYNYQTGQSETYSPRAGDVLISAAQPRSVLTQVLLEPRTMLSDSLTYDITAWALPYIYGLRAYAYTQRLDWPTSATAPTASEAALPERPYGYVLPYTSLREVRALAQLLKRGLRVRMTTKPITVGGQSLAEGTLLLTRADHPALGDRFDRDLRAVAAEFGIGLRALPSGLMEKGPDLGSGWIEVLKAPRVAVATGPTIDDNAFGSVWHFFEQELKYPITVIRAEQLGRARLRDFDVIILPDGSYGSILSSSTREALHAWIVAGGNLIAVDGALSSLAGREGFGLRSRSIDTAQAKLPSNPDLLPKYADRERDGLREAVAGAVLQVRLDGTHPLAYGVSNPYYTLKNSPRAYDYLRNGWNVGYLAPKAPQSGFIGSRVKARVAEGLLFGVESIGRGQVVYMADDPLFRSFWYGGKQLFGNAVFLLSSY